MTECRYCHKNIETIRSAMGRRGGIPFRCHRCGGDFCPGHRLPENHDCPSRVKINPGDYWKPKVPGKKGKFPKKKSNFPKKKKSKLGIIVLLLILVAAAVVVAPMGLFDIGNKNGCDARSESLRNEIGGETMYHPVLKMDVCISGICEPGIPISLAHYDRHHPSRDGIWTVSKIKNREDANVMMYALGYEYPTLFEQRSREWPSGFNEDPLGCYIPPGK